MTTEHKLCKAILEQANLHLKKFEGEIFDIINVAAPPSLDQAIYLAKIVSKLSPFLANMIEYHVVEILNQASLNVSGEWKRQDPGFPDATFKSKMSLEPGIEIKAWFPLATEITARFKESVQLFEDAQINIAVIAWLPQHIIFGNPEIIGIWTDTAKSLANSRDSHYHNPPKYLVFEPLDTSKRTRNLQQTNTSGYIFQGTDEEFKDAEKTVHSWGDTGKVYSTKADYQHRLQQLRAMYPYRLDTNFAKLDRIGHQSLEQFKVEVLETKFQGYSVQAWSQILRKPHVSKNRQILESLIMSKP